MLGDRDSEIAVLVEDTELVDSMMNDEPYKASKFIYDLRCHLWKVKSICKYEPF